MKLIYLVFVFTLLMDFSFSSFAGNDNTSDNKIRKLGLNTGYYNAGTIDELYSPFLYSGSNVSFGLKFIKEKEKRKDQFSFRFAQIKMTPENLVVNPDYFSENDMAMQKDILLLEFFDTYRFLLSEKGSRFIDFYLTGRWFSTVNLMTNYYILPELIQSGLGAGIYIEKNIKRHCIKAELNVPVLTLTVRNNYSQSDAQDYEDYNEFTFIFKNMQIQLPYNLLAVYSNIGYEYNISNHFTVEAEYYFNCMLNTSPRPLKSVSGIYSLGLIYTF